MSRKTDPKFIKAYDRSMLRAAFVSLFWGVIQERKKRGRYTLQELAKSIGSSKHEVSRWFNGDPNWTVNTIANLANALDLDIKIEATERKTGKVFTSSGVHESVSPRSISNFVHAPGIKTFVISPSFTNTSTDRPTERAA